MSTNSLRDRFRWVKNCQCERCGDHDQNKIGCPTCDFAHSEYRLFSNKEVLTLIDQHTQEAVERTRDKQLQDMIDDVTERRKHNPGAVIYWKATLDYLDTLTQTKEEE